ncbi:DUF2500 domain-containing protein [Oscillibacter valericigenes]|uniref:DUF2500 domain-containing protein n=1 Tax=Dysosmobacter sp. TaxID=2591382 RepID=UPI002097F26C|nr:DUF2500 domain-containing protein [Oscillibacter valericigenes]
MIGFGGDPGFDVTFSIMQVIMLLVFVLVLGSIIVTLIRGVGEWNKNNQSPKLTVPATVVAKRSDVHRGIETMHTFTSYYVTFQVESGDRMEFEVSDMEYGMLAEGDSGELTFQGTRYLNFQRNESAE